MPDIEVNTRTDWLRLRTLTFVRWMAIAGQLAALVIAQGYYHISLPLGLCCLVIGVSVIVNLCASFIFAQNKRLSEREAMFMLLFDLAQLVCLLFLTGGLTNPFALLLLAPVVISASALSFRSTVFLGLLAVAAVSALGLYSFPLRFMDGSTLVIPDVFAFGFWASITIGILFIGLYAHRIASEMHSMSDALFATQTALARAQKLTDLGGVVAAAAHELGTPLATIKLASGELMSELNTKPVLYEDARLIKEQAERCAQILRSMGQAGKDDPQMQSTALVSLLEEAAEPHKDRGKNIIFTVSAGEGGDNKHPIVRRRPEIIHGLRNVIQNAVDFAKTSVWVDAKWESGFITVRIFDDGDGYAPQIMNRLGDPFTRRRKAESDSERHPTYEGMGLGLFIAKTLLERSGAKLTFANASDVSARPANQKERSGAIVTAVWPYERLCAA